MLSGRYQDPPSPCSTSGMVFIFGGAAIAWKSKCQVFVALSSTEVEYVAVALMAKEGLWIKTIIEELDIFKLTEMNIFCDNQSCIKLSTNPIKINDQTSISKQDITLLENFWNQMKCSSLRCLNNNNVGRLLNQTLAT